MEDHWHDEDLNHVTKTNNHWTGPQVEVITKHIKYTGENNNQVILIQLKERSLSNGAGKYPTTAQVGNKKRNMKKPKKNYQVVIIADLVEICEKSIKNQKMKTIHMFPSSGLSP